jgi:N-acetylglucosamine kinase-like BadF-type ATPase
MLICAGIDGGQSSSTIVAGDERGAILATLQGPPLDLVGEAPGSRRRADRIDALLARVRIEAGIPSSRAFDAVVAALSGLDPEAPEAPLPAGACVQLVHDSEAAHAAALDGEAGVVVIAGTGSVALAIDAEGTRARAGGWGYFFGDEGGAIWIARRAIGAAMRAHDRGEPFAMKAALLERCGVDSLRAIQHAFAHGELSRVRLAACAPAVLAAAARDPIAAHICAEAARQLADLAAVAAAGTELREPLVSYAGGLFGDVALTAAFAEAAAALVPGARVAPPAHEPALGALLLAYRAAGIAPRLAKA